MAEAFGLAYAEGGDVDAAIDWYARAVRRGDGSASLRAAEQWANLLARRGAGRNDAVQGRDEIRYAIAHLQQLAALQTTVERESLLGSAWKRLAMVGGRRCSDAGGAAGSQQHYARAEAMAPTRVRPTCSIRS